MGGRPLGPSVLPTLLKKEDTGDHGRGVTAESHILIHFILNQCAKQ